MAEQEDIQGPDVERGLEYWETQPADYDGVLGGFGTGSLPRVDALGSRQFIMRLRPTLCTVPSALRPLDPPPPQHTRALDVGAGVGRVSSDTLLPLVDSVVLLEPVDAFARAALTAAPSWRGIAEQRKSARILRGTLQAFDPARAAETAELLGTVGAADESSGFDVVWCQWCLGHMSDEDLVAFFQRSVRSLRPEGLIVVKENLCSEGPDGSPRTIYDPEDASVTRSDSAWKAIFKAADLKLKSEKVQEGFPDGLYAVKMYALLPAL